MHRIIPSVTTKAARRLVKANNWIPSKFWDAIINDMHEAVLSNANEHNNIRF